MMDKILKHRIISSKKKRLSVLVEWTNNCNLNCPMCTIDNPKMRHKGHMSLDIWQQILDICKKEGHFVDWVHVLGEPLLWKHFYKGMRLWKESGLSQFGHISTNGILLTNKHIDCIAETGIDFIRICLDTLRPDVYTKIRANNNQDTVINNIHDFLERAPNIECQVQLMLTPMNRDESYEDIFKKFGRASNLRIFVTQCMDVGGDASLAYNKTINGDPRKCSKLNYEHCPITWDGQIGLCCVDTFLLNQLGTINAGSISKIYLGKKSELIRRNIRRGDFSLAPACESCPMDHINYECNLLKP